MLAAATGVCAKVVSTVKRQRTKAVTSMGLIQPKVNLLLSQPSSEMIIQHAHAYAAHGTVCTKATSLTVDHQPR